MEPPRYALAIAYGKDVTPTFAPGKAAALGFPEIGAGFQNITVVLFGAGLLTDERLPTLLNLDAAEYRNFVVRFNDDLHCGA